jgi:putative spermidine/putrescine transport system permease protein
VPFWISILVRAFAWILLLRAEGLINNLLIALHVIDDPLDLLYNEFGVIVGTIHYMIPIAVLTLYGQMEGIDRRLLTAARGLGAGPFFAFRTVFLPLSIPGIVAATILIFINGIGFFIIPALLGGGKTLMLAEYIGLLITTTVNWGLGTTLATVLVLIVLGLLFTMSRFVNLRRALGGT